ncbi:MAG: hypothetical protein IT510_07595 [Sulfuritalea sp.]|nr:hypothetical protein [Sulfuritalea sp.]
MNSPIMRNGFECVTRTDGEANMICAYSDLVHIQALFAAITRLAETPHSQSYVAQLSKLGEEIADRLSNDVDVLRERIVKAGLVGDLVAEGAAQ